MTALVYCLKSIVSQHALESYFSLFDAQQHTDSTKINRLGHNIRMY